MSGFFKITERWREHELDLAPLRLFGRKYFVDVGSGSDDASGQTPKQAFKTIQNAIDVLCALRTDIGATAMPQTRVFVAPGEYVENLEFSRIVSRWSIIGAGAHPEAVVVRSVDAADEEIFSTPGASAFSLENMTFKFPVGETTIKPALKFDIANYGYIRQCRIYGDRDSGAPTPDYGIYIGNALGLEIVKDYIYGFDLDGVHFHGGADKFANWCEVYENRIGACKNAAINKAASCVSAGLMIYRNKIDQTILSGNYGVYIADSYASISDNDIMMAAGKDAIYPAPDTAGVVSVNNRVVLHGSAAGIERALS